MVDTDVASYIHKNDTRAASYLSLLSGRLRIVSFMTLAEMLLWAERATWGASRRRDLAGYLRSFIVAPYDPDLCRTWAEVTDAARRAGRPIATADAWIAATAIHYGLPLVTNNPADYVGVARLSLLTL